jgi:hypothetical protein
MRVRVVGIVALVGLAACTGSSGVTEVTARPTVTQPTPTSAPNAGGDSDPADGAPERTAGPSAPAVAVGPAIVDGVANGLVLVLDIDGGDRSLVSYRADGTEVANYSVGPDEFVVQPIWSPDGTRVAWVRTTDGATWELVTAAVDGGDRSVHPLPGRPDYITYDPTVSRVLALTPSPQGFGLVIVELGAEPDPGSSGDPSEPVDVGLPYFSDFAPGGDRLVAHVGDDVRIVDLTGEITPLAATGGTHQTPLWHPSDDTVYYTADVGDGEQLLAHRLDSDITTELGAVAGFVFFDIDPRGERLAVMAYGVPTNGGADALRNVGTPRSSSAGDTVLDTGLWIIDLADGRARLIDDRPSGAPMWDPTGSRVLVRDGFGGVGRWRVLGVDGTRASTDVFDIDGTLLPSYLPFWDQYARSQTVWSPDGTQFVHPGLAANGEAGVWIHDAATSGPSTLLAPGDIAFWSPT